MAGCLPSAWRRWLFVSRPGLLGSQTWLCVLPDLNLAAQVSAASLSARQACMAVETNRVCSLPPDLQQRPWLPWGSQLCIAGQRFQRPPYSFVQQLSISCRGTNHRPHKL